MTAEDWSGVAFWIVLIVGGALLYQAHLLATAYVVLSSVATVVALVFIWGRTRGGTDWDRKAFWRRAYGGVRPRRRRRR